MQGSVKCSVSVFGVVWDGLIIVVVVIIADYKELRMPIILEKQMDILNHKHLCITQKLQFGTK